MEGDTPGAGAPPPGGGGDEAVELVTIFRGSPSEVIAVRATLEALGFRTFIRDDNTRTIDPFILGGNAFLTELQTASTDAERAVAALEEAEARAASGGVGADVDPDADADSDAGEDPDSITGAESAAGGEAVADGDTDAYAYADGASGGVTETDSNRETEREADAETGPDLPRGQRWRILVEVGVVMAIAVLSAWYDPGAPAEGKAAAAQDEGLSRLWSWARWMGLIVLTLLLMGSTAREWADFGIRRLRWRSDLGGGALLGILLGGFSELIYWVLGPALLRFDWAPPPALDPDARADLWTLPSWLDWILYAACSAVLYQGYLVSRLEQARVATGHAIVVAAVAAGLTSLAAGLYLGVDNFLQGLLLGSVFAVSRSVRLIALGTLTYVVLGWLAYVHYSG